MIVVTSFSEMITGVTVVWKIVENAMKTQSYLSLKSNNVAIPTLGSLN